MFSDLLRPRRRAGRLALALAILASGALAGRASYAQPYPSRPTTILVPYTAGGVVDVIARVVADQLRTSLGQPVVVENKVGAGGNIGMGAVANAPPDGYTLLLASPAFTINPSLYSGLSWDPVRSFEPIGMIGVVPNVLVVHPSVKAGTLKDFIALAKSKPGEFSYASAGAGSSNHLAAELLKSQTGIDLVHVPYKGQPDALRDLLTGRVQFMAITMALVQEYVAAGQLKALAVTTRSRSSRLPDVPTAREAGLDDFEVAAWFGLLAPARTPPEIVKRLNAELRSMLAKPEVTDRLRPIGLEPEPGSPEDLASFIAADKQRWAETIQRAKIKID